MVSRCVVIGILISLAGCTATPEVIREVVRVPVIEYRLPPPPAELVAPFSAGSGVEFVGPGNTGAMVCLTEAGAAALRADITRAAGKLEAWRAWTKGWDTR